MHLRFVSFESGYCQLYRSCCFGEMVEVRNTICGQSGLELAPMCSQLVLLFCRLDRATFQPQLSSQFLTVCGIFSQRRPLSVAQSLSFLFNVWIRASCQCDEQKKRYTCVELGRGGAFFNSFFFFSKVTESSCYIQLSETVVTGSCQREGCVYIVMNGERSRSFERCNLWIAVK